MKTLNKAVARYNGISLIVRILIGLIMAGAALAAVPIIIIFLIFQKYFTKGIAMGAVKG